MAVAPPLNAKESARTSDSPLPPRLADSSLVRAGVEGATSCRSKKRRHPVASFQTAESSVQANSSSYHPSARSSAPRTKTLRTLLRQPLFRGRSGLVIPGQERDFIGGEYAVNRLAGKLAGDDEGSACSDCKSIFFKIDIYPFYDVFKTHVL